MKITFGFTQNDEDVKLRKWCADKSITSAGNSMEECIKNADMLFSYIKIGQVEEFGCSTKEEAQRKIVGITKKETIRGE
jgi:hypothetical protein